MDSSGLDVNARLLDALRELEAARLERSGARRFTRAHRHLERRVEDRRRAVRALVDGAWSRGRTPMPEDVEAIPSRSPMWMVVWQS